MGGSSGGSSQPVEQTVTQTQFPEEAKPYYSRLLSRGEAESLQPYAAYPSQRLAQFAPEEQQAFGMTRQLAMQGTPFAQRQAEQTASQIAQGSPFEPFTGFQQQMQPMYGGFPPPIRPPMMSGFESAQQRAAQQQPSGYGGVDLNKDPRLKERGFRQSPMQMQSFGLGRFSPRRPSPFPPMPRYQSPMERYMSPYQQGVTDIAKERAIRDADRTRSEIGLNAASQGALGGYREGIVESNLNRDLLRNLSNIQTQGLQSGFESAQQQFERDRAARMAQQQQQLSGAQLLGGFAPQAQQMALERIGALGGVGGQRRGFRQAGLDIGYEDFLRQEGYPRQQIGFQSNIIRGLALPPSQTVSSYAQRPGLFQQTLGAGLGALGLYQGMGGGRRP
tara:strand:+ start:6178 stop:7347 length:1170 start_codon:yes stop_codon:yes gene_type:complete